MVKFESLWDPPLFNSFSREIIKHEVCEVDFLVSSKKLKKESIYEIRINKKFLN